jgi:hypothetical protein
MILLLSRGRRPSRQLDYNPFHPDYRRDLFPSEYVTNDDMIGGG